MYYLLGCELCHYLIQAVTNVNQSLPIGEKIELVNIFSNDPRLSYLANIYKSEDPFDWRVPIMIIDTPSIEKKFNSFVKTMNRKRIVFKSADSVEHSTTMLKRLIGG